MTTLPGGGVAGSGSSLPPDWQSLPTTQASFNAAVQAVSANYPPAQAASFRSWYAAAWAKDPQITPDQAVSAWAVAEGLGTGISDVGQLVGSQVPSAAAGAAGSLTGNGILQGLSGTVGKLESILGNPLKFVLGASGFSGWFARGLKVLFGGVLLLAGIIRLSGTDKTLKEVLPVAGGPAGKVLRT